MDLDTEPRGPRLDARQCKGASAMSVIDAFPLTERQQNLIFKSLDHCRRVLATEPGDEDLEQELTATMRLFAERD